MILPIRFWEHLNALRFLQYRFVLRNVNLPYIALHCYRTLKHTAFRINNTMVSNTDDRDTKPDRFDREYIRKTCPSRKQLLEGDYSGYFGLMSGLS
jgi:hypothetical protein